ncbi:hypothetical protein ACFLYB_06550 [Chloroflexota bacterium]
MNSSDKNERIFIHNSIESIETSISDQLASLSLPESHAKLIKAIALISPEGGEEKGFTKEQIAAGACVDTERGFVYLVLNIKPAIAHEIGHLVWQRLLTKEKQEDFNRLQEKNGKEILNMLQRVARKHQSNAILPREHFIMNDEGSLEEFFAWSYALHVYKDIQFHEQSPTIDHWLNTNVF